MKLISRDEALKDQNFASFIYHWQNLSNPVLEDSPDEKEVRAFQQIMDKKPHSEAEVTKTIVILPHKPDDRISLIQVLINLQSDFETEFTVIPFFRKGWFSEDISQYHTETIDAYDSMVLKIGEKDFKGGVKIQSQDDIKEFMPEFFCLVEGNYIPYGFFYIDKLQVVCSYHYSTELIFYCFSVKSEKQLSCFIKTHELRTR